MTQSINIEEIPFVQKEKVVKLPEKHTLGTAKIKSGTNTLPMYGIVQ